MNDRLPPEIQDLHAYVDGELGPEARSRVETRLKQDPQARECVAAYRRLDQGLHKLFDPVLAEPVPAPMRQPTLRPRRAHRLRTLAASLVLLLGGVWIGAQLQQG